MPFTDEQLKRLKECLKGNGECNVYCEGECADIPALLARLEAAERCIKEIEYATSCGWTMTRAPQGTKEIK